MLKERIQNELKESLKKGDQNKRLVLGMLMTSVKNKELAKRQQLSKILSDATDMENQSQLSDDEIIEVISSELKKRKESVEQFIAGGRQELVDKERAEIDILLTYLPEQLNEEEISKEIKSIISSLGAQGLKDMGKVISAVMTKLKGRADGTTVSRIVKES